MPLEALLSLHKMEDADNRNYALKSTYYFTSHPINIGIHYRVTLNLLWNSI